MDFFDEFSILLEGGGSANRFTGNHLDRRGDVGISIVGASEAARAGVRVPRQSTSRSPVR